MNPKVYPACKCEENKEEWDAKREASKGHIPILFTSGFPEETKGIGRLGGIIKTSSGVIFIYRDQDESGVEHGDHIEAHYTRHIEAKEDEKNSI